MKLEDLDGWGMDVYSHRNWIPMCFGPKRNLCIEADEDLSHLYVEFEAHDGNMERTTIPLAVLANYLRTIGFRVEGPNGK